MDKDQVFTVEELESRFEMEALAGPGFDMLPDWSCECSLKVVV